MSTFAPRRPTLVPLRRGPILLTSTTVLAAVIVTVVVALTPNLHFAYRSEAAHLVLETADAAIAAIVAVLLYGRFRRNHALPDLLLGYAMALLSIAAIGFAIIPVLSGADATDAVRTWAPLLIRITGAGLFAAAGLVPRGRVALRHPSHDLSVLLLIVGTILVASLLAPHALPVALDPTLHPEGSGSSHVTAHPGVLAAQLTQLVLYGIASISFTLWAARTGDEFTSWIGAAAGLSAVARVNYLLFPSLFSEYVYVGDFLRTGCYVMLFVGAAREIEKYWVQIASAAAIQERQRVARDLHDGLTQELTYIWSQLQQLEKHPERRELLPRLTSASARAIDEARRAIAALTRPIDEPLSNSLTQAAEEVAIRYGASVATEIAPVEVDTERREALIRIVREAVSNAARYAGAADLVVRLVREHDVLRLTVADDGYGFDTEAVRRRRGGYGLSTMKQRAEQTGGRFELQSRPGGGTTVTVVWDA